MDNNIKVLDCTFRDGGYYNNWDFNQHLSSRYLRAVQSANIDIIELGFRNFPKKQFFGAYAYTTDHYVDTLNINQDTVVAVMIDATSILNAKRSITDAIECLFQAKEKSRVDLVRIATNFDVVDKCQEIAQHLNKLGYQIGLNLMKANLQPDEVLSAAAKQIQQWRVFDVLYFADSLGGMNGRDVARVIKGLKSHWTGEIGFHAHNNKGLAVANTLVAMECGATWLDATVLGMGRGAGNAQTESLLLELKQKHQLDYQPSALFDLVLSDFTPLQNYYHWGENLLYSLAAMEDIHPTYVQEMLVDGRYNSREVLQMLEFLSSIDASSYNKNLLLHARGSTNNNGSWNAKDWCLNKEVLILGAGIGLQTYEQGIIQYIKIHKPIVIALNVEHSFPKQLIDVYVASNEAKMLAECRLYSTLDKPLAIPLQLLKKVLDKRIEIETIWDYGLNIKRATLLIDNMQCTLPYELSIGYALSLASIGGAKSINLVGFDGYDKSDIRQDRMNELLDLFTQQCTLPIAALTPSTYHITQSSIYAEKL